MLKTFLKTTVFVVLFFIPRTIFGAVLINEIAWMGTTIDYNDEWMELLNPSDQSIDLTGWKIEAADGTPIISLSGNIPANGYFLLERTDDSSIPAIVADQIYAGALGNSGEDLKLKDSSGNIIDEVNAAGGWPAGDNVSKQTMQKINNEWKTGDPTPKAENSASATPENETTPSTEQTTQQQTTTNNPPLPEAGNDIVAFIGQKIKFDGTKSTDPENDELAYSWNMGDGKLIEKPIFEYQYLYPGTYVAALMVYDGRNYAVDTITIKIQSILITINEFMPNPQERDEDSEWVEVYNNSSNVADISGWQLDDGPEGSKPFIFPQNTLIAPKSYMVLPAQITGITLNNDKDSVRLLMPEGIIFQEIAYEKPPQNKSSARTAEGFVWLAPTPGTTNFVFAQGTENRKVAYQGNANIQVTKTLSRENTIQYSATDKILEGGYTEISPEKNSTENQLASARETISNHVSENLIYVLVIIILSGLIIGLFLAKIRKSKNEFPKT